MDSRDSRIPAMGDGKAIMYKTGIKGCIYRYVGHYMYRVAASVISIENQQQDQHYSGATGLRDHVAGDVARSSLFCTFSNNNVAFLWMLEKKKSSQVN